MTEPILQAEAFIRFRLDDLASRNEHHRFEDIATRIARKRISANILLATGPVSAGGDQGRDSESYTTRIPDELPHAAGFAASASTDPVVIACTVQKGGLKGKVGDDLAAICAEGTDPVSHVAYFSVHPIPAGATHELKAKAKDTYGVSLDVFSGSDLATILAEPDLVWVAREYLELPSFMVPEPEGDPAPEWYIELIGKLRQNGGPAALTPATQGEITQGLRHATWDKDTNADLPEWIDFMSAFLADVRSGVDTDLVFRACYEIAIARFRGTGHAAGVEDLVRRALAFSRESDQPNIIDDGVTLVSYWGSMWVSGAGRAEAQEITDALQQLSHRAADLLNRTNSSTHPVRAASLTGTLAFLHLLPDWRHAELMKGRPARVDVAAHAGVVLNETDVDVTGMTEEDLIDAHAAMSYLDDLIDLLPRARAYPVSQLARVFNLMAPVVANHPSYRKVRDGLDARTAEIEGEATKAERCRDRGAAFARAGKPLLALAELHNAKLNWFNGETMYGSVLASRSIAHLYADLKLTFAAKLYACAAAAVALSHGDDDLKEQAPNALLDAARFLQQAGCWVDGAAFTEIALLARAAHLPEPFDLERFEELGEHHTNSVLGLSVVRKLWPELEPLIAAAYSRTPDWYADLSETVGLVGENPMTEDAFEATASQQLTGPVFSDVGLERMIEFAALGVRWSFTFANSRVSVVTSEALVAAFQVFLADIATFEPVVLSGTVHVTVDVVQGASTAGTVGVDVDRSDAEFTARVILSPEDPDGSTHQRELVAICFELLTAVIARPASDLYALMEPMFEAGLLHKMFAVRPYEEVTDFLNDAHYARSAAATRPAITSRFRPDPAPPLAPVTTTGNGYERDRSLQLIRERYEVAGDVLRYTLPRLIENQSTRHIFVELRADGWLDWQILVALVNVMMNWRMQQAGMHPGVGDPAAAIRLGRQPETASSPPIPLEAFSAEKMSFYMVMQTQAVGATWQLRGRTEHRNEGALRDLLTRRYHYATDDLPHRDLLGDEVVINGLLQPFLISGGQ